MDRWGDAGGREGALGGRSGGGGGGGAGGRSGGGGGALGDSREHAGSWVSAQMKKHTPNEGIYFLGASLSASIGFVMMSPMWLASCSMLLGTVGGSSSRVLCNPEEIGTAGEKVSKN